MDCRESEFTRWRVLSTDAVQRRELTRLRTRFVVERQREFRSELGWRMLRQFTPIVARTITAQQRRDDSRLVGDGTMSQLLNFRDYFKGTEKTMQRRVPVRTADGYTGQASVPGIPADESRVEVARLVFHAEDGKVKFDPPEDSETPGSYTSKSESARIACAKMLLNEIGADISAIKPKNVKPKNVKPKNVKPKIPSPITERSAQPSLNGSH